MSIIWSNDPAITTDVSLFKQHSSAFHVGSPMFIVVFYPRVSDVTNMTTSDKMQQKEAFQFSWL